MVDKEYKSLEVEGSLVVQGVLFCQLIYAARTPPWPLLKIADTVW